MENTVISKILLLGTLLWQLGTTVTLASPLVYNPLPIRFNQSLTDELSVKDIPTGEGGFARDYRISLQSGDQITIDLTSDEFDTFVALIAPDGSTVGENDDSSDGTTNSLLFARIKEAGEYIIRVRSSGATGTGKFTMKVTHLVKANR